MSRDLAKVLMGLRDEEENRWICRETQMKMDLVSSMAMNSLKIRFCVILAHQIKIHGFIRSSFSPKKLKSIEETSKSRTQIAMKKKKKKMRTDDEFEVMDEECSKKQLKDILQTDSSLKRSDEEIALLDSYASVKSPLVISTGRNTHRKRARLPPDEESDVVDLPCPQCGTELAGFQCNQNTIHLQCQACGGMMPSRNNLSVPQHCLGCDRAFCGAYWRAQSVFESDSHPVCSHEALKPISEHTITRIPQLAHENNQHEQDITERCISQTGRTLQDVISDWITKLENREIDRTRMPLNHAEMITAATHICSFYHQMQLRGKIAGMDIHVGRSTTVKNMLVKEIMFAVQPGVEICRYTFIAGKDGCEVSC
ncbi:unnamed protein product [Camellia sinensis]